MNSKITYHQQVSYCGKPRCKRCREGVGHGPYWYAYQTVNGRTSRKYIGKHLPAEVQAEMTGEQQPVAPPVAEREQSTIRIYVLGQFRLERRNPRDQLEWQTVTDSSWQHQRVRALLGCLVSVGGRKLGREQIMDALWPDLDVDTAGSRLDRAVYSLRQLFEPARNKPATSPLLLTEREMIVLADHPQVWIDADALEQLIIRAHESKDPGEKELLFKEAVALYGGEFLPEDRRNEWTRVRRESLQRGWIGLLLELADLMVAREAFIGAIDPLDRLLSIDPTNEAAVQRLIKILERLGRRGEALRAYKKLAAVLQKEYNIAPLPETRALYEALRSGGERGGEGDEQGTAVELQAGVLKGRGRGKEREVGATVVEGPVVQVGRLHQSPLVGRQVELAHLKELVAHTEQSAKFRLGAQKRATVSTLDPHRRAQCVLLMGDVGIGKTRLAEEVGREAKARGWAVAWSRVYAQEGAIPYRLWTEVLRKAMEQGVWQREEVRKKPLAFHSLGTLLPELHELLPQVAFPASLSPEQEQLRLWEAARELLTLISESTPLLIALDDLQWADSSSCELLAYLARRTHGHPIVIVGTCRENELGPDHPLRHLLTDLRRENAVETLGLEPLSTDQIESLVTQVTQAAEPLVQRISSRAGGNPFFAEELARTVVESRPELVLGLPQGPEEALPETITAVLTLRLGRLSTPCQRLLSKAAVLGGSFEFQVISAMEAKSGTYDEDEILELLEEALKSGMLTEEGIGTRITYHFWHPLLASHLYEMLSAARRASQHRRAAQVLQDIYKGHEEEGAAAITNHLMKGGADAEQVAHFAELAGKRAYTLSSYSDAERYFRVALEHLDERFDDWNRLAYVLEMLGDCTRVQGKYEEARGFYERVLGVHQRNSSSLSLNYAQEAQIQALILCEIAKAWYDWGNLGEAKAYAKRSEQILLDAKIEQGPAWAHLKMQQGYIYWREGRYDDARVVANDALHQLTIFLNSKESGNSSQHLGKIRRTLDGDPVDLGRIHILLSNVEATGNRCTDGLPHSQKALAIFEQYDCIREIAIVCCNLGDIYLRAAEYSQAQAVLRRSLSMAERIGEMPLYSAALGNIGILDMRTGSLLEAEKELQEVVERVRGAKDSIFESVFCSYYGMVLTEQGRLSEARKEIYQAIKLNRTLRVEPCLGLALVTAGQLRLSQAFELSQEKNDKALKKRRTILLKARKSLKYALTLNGLEAESRVEGRLALSLTLLWLNEVDEALRNALLALDEAQKAELGWLVARANYVLGDIYISKEHYIEAADFYQIALQIFKKLNMQLEYARVLRELGLLLFKEQNNSYSQGIKHLHEASRIFEDCKALVDLQLTKDQLKSLELVSKRY